MIWKQKESSKDLKMIITDAWQNLFVNLLQSNEGKL